MKDILRILLLLALIAWVLWLLYKEYRREQERQELAKKNMSFIESINLTGLPIISFSNNGHIVNMVLDTGSNVCLINKDSLASFQYEIAGTHSDIIGLSGGAENGTTVYLPLKYKDLDFDFECWATDINDMIASFKKEYGVTIHGLLGTGFFQKYQYILDFKEMIAYSLANRDRV